jgi:hypothetical protein
MKKIKIIILLKENSGMTILSILLLTLGIFSRDKFFIIVLLYIYSIKLLLSDYFREKTKKYIAMVIWTVAIFVFASGYYVNHYLPRGEMYPTGDIVCQNDDRGPCGEEYKEDLRGLDNPSWAIFLKENGIPLMIALAFAGIVVSAKKSQE